MTPAGPNTADNQGPNPDEERLGELINEYLDRLDRGESLTAEAFLAEHPEHAEALREHFQGLELLAGLGGSSAGQVGIETGVAPAPRGSSAQQPLGGDPTAIPRIPGYEIHKQIGRGGMGLVYKATQVSTRRVVALKLLLEGPFASDGARRRFEREIALAAQLRHPNIIPIYDSGTSEGRMYYAMEYIYGLPLNDHLRAHALDIRARLALFVRICQAVSHAHQRGVIHRDLKPSNILVDGSGEPHILDFGLAKAGSLGDMTTSMTAQILGTPAYMSPEQASGDPSGIDIRTDVYSLGVVLFEALTGSMPYETNVAMGKILQNIAHAEPASPSRLNAAIDAEVSAIVLKALEKGKDRRYQSVDGLGADIQRYLDGQPIFASPPSSWYLLRKVVRRHRRIVGAVGAVLVLSIGGWIFFREFKSTLVVKEQQAEQIRRQSEENLALRKAVEAKQLALETQQRERDEEERIRRRQAQQAIQLMKKNIEKTYGRDQAKMLEGLAALGEALSGGDPTAALGEFVGGVIPPGKSEDSGRPAKGLDFDPAELVPRSSPKPADVETDEADSSAAREDWMREAARVWERMQAEARAQKAASRPASTSRPAVPSSAPTPADDGPGDSAPGEGD
jgi:serine/threonine protein kinase